MMEETREKDRDRNMANGKKKAVLVISFGTSHRRTREKTLDAIEREIQKEFSDWEFRRAYTSPTIRRILKEREGITVESVEEALGRLWQEGYRMVLAQSTHVIQGYEYDRMKATIARYQEKFDALVCGEPLLTEEEDYREVARVLGQELKSFRRPGTDRILVGHGTEHEANVSYSRLRQALLQEGYEDILVGTVESSDAREDRERLMRERRPRRVVLVPLLVVAGEHACRDMAGEQEDSWKSWLLCRGCEVECLFKGMGEYAGIRQIYLRHARKAEEKLRDRVPSYFTNQR